MIRHNIREFFLTHPSHSPAGNSRRGAAGGGGGSQGTDRGAERDEAVSAGSVHGKGIPGGGAAGRG